MTKIISAHRISLDEARVLAEGSVPADLTFKPCLFWYIAAAVGLRQLFLLQINNTFMELSIFLFLMSCVFTQAPLR